MRSFSKFLAVATGALALLIAPISIDELSPILGAHSAFADKGGGGHSGAGGADGNGGGNAGGNGGGNGGSNAGGNGKGNALGRDMAASRTDGASPGIGNAFGYGNGASGIAKTDPMHPSKLGRLNAFFNASSTALAATSPNSAIGTVSKTYRDMLSAYMAGEDDVDLDDLATALATAANKTLTPEQVDAINERLATENPTDPNLADFANPTGDPAIDAENDALAAELATRANELQAEETSQGLGQRLASFFDSVF
jgi:hypothetical protein